MKKNNLKAWLYLLPAILFLGVFMVYPLIDVCVYSVEENYNFASQSFTGVGLGNFRFVLSDPYFVQALKNTFLIVAITVPLSTGFALLISLGLSSIKTLRNAFQTIYFLPYVTNTLAVGLVFMILFKKTAYSDGMVNLLINKLGGSSVDFIDGLDCYALQDPDSDKCAGQREPGLLQGGQGGRRDERTDFPENYPAYDQSDGVLSDYYRIYRRFQGIQRRGGPLRHEPECRRDEHDRRLCI